jgi:hypothetical protein
MPRGNARRTEVLAVEIIRKEEIARGWKPGPALSKRRKAEAGCDFLSTPPGGGEPEAVEVKSLGHSLLGVRDPAFLRANVNPEQVARARRDPHWRLEIVANLAAVQAGTGEIERLTLRAGDVVGRVTPAKYWVALSGMEQRIEQRPIELLLEAEPVVGTAVARVPRR